MAAMSGTYFMVARQHKIGDNLWVASVRVCECASVRVCGWYGRG